MGNLLTSEPPGKSAFYYPGHIKEFEDKGGSDDNDKIMKVIEMETPLVMKTMELMIGDIRHVKISEVSNWVVLCFIGRN